MILFSSTAKGVQLVNVTSSPQLKPTPITNMLLPAFTAALLGASSVAGWGTIVAQTYTGKQCTGRIHELYHDEKCAPYDPDAASILMYGNAKCYVYGAGGCEGDYKEVDSSKGCHSMKEYWGTNSMYCVLTEQK
ncbi:hypothetical protein ACCO45_007016 [Purpureocillium lilacinum]|uniref:Uncharacterized protein n=1 Tax=Purpureocillium lilacinum TaxID=33203 RepID=A0ACC4DSK6_PURLI